MNHVVMRSRIKTLIKDMKALNKSNEHSGGRCKKGSRCNRCCSIECYEAAIERLELIIEEDDKASEPDEEPDIKIDGTDYVVAVHKDPGGGKSLVAYADGQPTFVQPLTEEDIENGYTDAIQEIVDDIGEATGEKPKHGTISTGPR